MKQLIWDLPTRIFHWAFAGSILLAFGFGKFSSEHSVYFGLHMVFGVLAGLLLLWRVIWGIAGTKHARFASLLFSPGRIIEYFRSVISGKGQYFAGHNPGSSVSIWAMLILAGLAVLSGLSMGFLGETFEEVHEIVTVLVIAAAAFHIAGVILASFMHSESYLASMLTGRKTADPGEQISSARPAAALLMVLLTAGAMTYVWRGFDLNTRTFSAPGTSFRVQFGEDENEEEGGRGENEEEEEDDDD